MEPLKFKRRGRRTFTTLLILRLYPALIFLLALLVLVSFQGYIFSSVSSLAGPASDVLTRMFTVVVEGGFVFFFILCLILVFVAWLQYISVEYVMDDMAFKARLGIINIREMSIPYRQIQNIDIDRPLSYRLLGMSRVVIITAGHEDTDVPERDEVESAIDLLDKKGAEELQHELLHRSALQSARILHPVDPTDVHTY